MHEEGYAGLREVLDAAGVRTAYLVGHSDGGSIALLHASTPRAVPRVRGLLLEAPHVFCEEVTVRAIGQARHEYLNGDLRARLARYHGTNVECAFWGWNRAWLDPGFRAWNIEDCLPFVTVPVLVIQGTDDPRTGRSSRWTRSNAGAAEGSADAYSTGAGPARTGTGRGKPVGRWRRSSATSGGGSRPGRPLRFLPLSPIFRERIKVRGEGI